MHAAWTRTCILTTTTTTTTTKTTATPCVASLSVNLLRWNARGVRFSFFLPPFLEPKFVAEVVIIVTCCHGDMLLVCVRAWDFFFCYGSTMSHLTRAFPVPASYLFCGAKFTRLKPARTLPFDAFLPSNVCNSPLTWAAAGAGKKSARSFAARANAFKVY